MTGWRPSSATVKILAFLSLLIFVGALLAHLLTFSANPSINMRQVDPIGVAIFIPFLCMLLVLSSYKATLNNQGAGPLERIRRTNRASREFVATLVSSPMWVRIVSVTFFVYVAVNFWMVMKVMQDGNPEETNAGYYVNNHGQLVRESTEVEYRSLSAYQVRGFSGHWMFFSFLPLVYFAIVEPRQRALAESRLLPQRVFCPRCNNPVTLTLQERTSGEFKCGRCNEEFMIEE